MDEVCQVCKQPAEWKIQPEPAKGGYTLIPDYYCDCCLPRWARAFLKQQSHIIRRIERKEKAKK